MDDLLCVISARGGSTGVKNKNTRDLLGKPLIAWSIEQALASKYIETVIVSTDSPDIAKIAQQFGAEVPFKRPSVLASAESGKFAVWKHALTECEKTYDKSFTAYVDLDCTNPLRDPSDIDNVIEMYMENQADGVFTVCQARKNPYFNLVEPDKNGFLDFSKRVDPPIVRRQDAPDVFEHVASIYALRPEFIRKSQNLFDGRLLGYDIGVSKSFDLDSEFDFMIIESLLKQRVS